jgi:hypothetical protein
MPYATLGTVPRRWGQGGGKLPAILPASAFICYLLLNNKKQMAKATPQNNLAYNKELSTVAHSLRNEMTKAEAACGNMF